MKSGAGDDPFFDDDESDIEDTPVEEAIERPSQSDSEPVAADSPSDQTATNTELPYKYRRDSVKDGRAQQPMFPQESTEELIETTVSEIKSEFDEEVYKTDVVEALIVAGGEETTPVQCFDDGDTE